DDDVFAQLWPGAAEPWRRAACRAGLQLQHVCTGADRGRGVLWNFYAVIGPVGGPVWPTENIDRGVAGHCGVWDCLGTLVIGRFPGGDVVAHSWLLPYGRHVRADGCLVARTLPHQCALHGLRHLV